MCGAAYAPTPLNPTQHRRKWYSFINVIRMGTMMTKDYIYSLEVCLLKGNTCILTLSRLHRCAGRSVSLLGYMHSCRKCCTPAHIKVLYLLHPTGSLTPNVEKKQMLSFNVNFTLLFNPIH